jgi:hypothetical protein
VPDMTLTEGRFTRFLSLAVAAILTLPAACFFCVSLYQIARAGYCGCFFESKVGLTLLWCSYISYDFRPDLVLLVVCTAFVHPIIFTLKTRAYDFAKKIKITVILYSAAAIVFAIQQLVFRFLTEVPWR